MSLIVALMALLVALVSLGLQLVDRSTLDDGLSTRIDEFDQEKRRLAKSFFLFVVLAPFTVGSFAWSWFAYIRHDRIEEIPFWLSTMGAFSAVYFVVAIFGMSWWLYALCVALRDSNQLTFMQFVQAMRG